MFFFPQPCPTREGYQFLKRNYVRFQSLECQKIVKWREWVGRRKINGAGIGVHKLFQQGALPPAQQTGPKWAGRTISFTFGVGEGKGEGDEDVPTTPPRDGRTDHSMHVWGPRARGGGTTPRRHVQTTPPHLQTGPFVRRRAPATSRGGGDPAQLETKCQTEIKPNITQPFHILIMPLSPTPPFLCQVYFISEQATRNYIKIHTTTIVL